MCVIIERDCNLIKDKKKKTPSNAAVVWGLSLFECCSLISSDCA